MAYACSLCILTGAVNHGHRRCRPQGVLKGQLSLLASLGRELAEQAQSGDIDKAVLVVHNIVVLAKPLLKAKF